MTVLVGKLSDVAKSRAVKSFWITAYEDVRGNESNDGLVIAWEHVQKVNSDTSFTTPDLEPGGAWIQWNPNGKRYYIEIPDSGSPVNIAPLVEAGLPAPPNTPFGQFVANGGNSNRQEVLSAAEYSSLISGQTPDPGSLFFTY